MRLSIIAAVSTNGVIGCGGKLPWHLADDLKRFQRLTMGHTIVMGRKTWESIGRPLAGRRMIVISRQADYCSGFDNIEIVGSLAAALDMAAAAGDDEAFIIGGAELYREALPRADRLYVTRVLAEVAGDAYFPDVDWDDWPLTASESNDADTNNDYPHRFEIYERNAKARKTTL
jgi:dihydrofolate reductase